jgi:hypothetical protein
MRDAVMANIFSRWPISTVGQAPGPSSETLQTAASVPSVAVQPWWCRRPKISTVPIVTLTEERPDQPFMITEVLTSGYVRQVLDLAHGRLRDRILKAKLSY